MKPELPRPFASDPGPVARLLGAAEAAGGPLALLGLTPAAVSDEAVAAALERQLERLRHHPQWGTPEADEVVMALHAAAAQLLDPNVRPHVLAQWAPAGPMSARAAPSPLAPWEMRRFRQEARSILARFGGFNERSLRKLALAARKFGMSVEHLPVVLPAILGPGGAPGGPMPFPVPAIPAPARQPVPRPSAGRDEAASVAAPLPEQMDPAVRLLRLGLIFAGIALLVLLLGLGGAWLLLTNLKSDTTTTATPEAGKGPAAVSRPAPELFPSGAERGAPTAPDASKTPAPDDDAEALLRDLAMSVEGLSINSAEAVAQFESAVGGLGGRWGRLPPDKLASAHDAVVEFVYRCSRSPDVAARAANAVASGASALRGAEGVLAADRIWPAAWSVGLLARLAREHDLPAGARVPIESALTSVAGGSAAGGSGTFAWGATSAAIAMPRLMVVKETSPAHGGAISPLEAWRAWAGVVSALCGQDLAMRSRLLLSGLETVLLEGPEPGPGTEAARVVGELAVEVGWRPGDDSRRRLLRWFDLAGMTSLDLHALTETLAARSAAQGVDVSMVLPIGADEPQRREMRDRYAAAWGLEAGPEHDALVQEWVKAIAEHAAGTEGESPVQQLARAVVLSRLNEAAGLLYAGETAPPGELIRKAAEPVTTAMASSQGRAPARPLEEGASDGSWSVRYLAAERNIPARAALLTELARSSGVLGPADAEALMVEALRGSPYQVRKQAQDLVLKFAGSPAVVNAALEQAVNIPRTFENADLIRRISLASLPPVKDPSWRAAVRRALVERLLEMLAARGDSGVIDALGTLLAQSYQDRAFVGQVERAPGMPAEKSSAEVAARAARLSWLRWAQAATPSGREPVSLEQIARRQAGREELASGLVQDFAAQQAGLCELMAYVVVTEQPGEGQHAAAVLERLGTARRTADHVFSQILAGERAMAELWSARLGVTAP